MCIAEFLLEKGANANVKDVQSFVPLQYAGENDSSMYKLLYQKTEKTLIEIEFVSEETEHTNKLSSIHPIIKPEFDQLDVSNKIETHESIFSLPQTTRASSIMNISMQVLGDFMAAVGCAAIAAAFIFLNAATFSTAGLVVAGLGAASILARVGLFCTGTNKNRQTTPNESLGHMTNLSY